MTKLTTKERTRKLVLGAMFTALVVVLQLLGSFIRFGPFSVSLVLVPIVLGAALCGAGIGAWLGFVFGITVLLSGDAAAFMSIDVFGTIVTVLLKGVLCGLLSGLAYKAFEKRNRYIAVILSAIVCPVVNTGVFFLGCLVFFLETIAGWGASSGFKDVASYMFLGLAGGNFIFEFLSNMILSPVILRVLSIGKK